MLLLYKTRTHGRLKDYALLCEMPYDSIKLTDAVCTGIERYRKNFGEKHHKVLTIKRKASVWQECETI